MIVDLWLSWVLGGAEWLRDFSASHLGPLDPFPIGNAWSRILDLDYFLPIHELFLFTLAVFSLGPAGLLTSVVVWLLVGVARGGAPKL
ncbi:hypothetical protein [Kineococcus sp. SYSU DK018]|uniref:hypothetical protein n=1 Tax=Kineococcus sp. SYSU DK018 TaxID=3383139 RepID=UPI003D7CF817